MTQAPLNATADIGLPGRAVGATGAWFESATVRSWLRAFGWTLAVVGLFLVFNVFEKYEGFFEFHKRRALPHRMFQNPATMAMRVFGLPHFILAILFAVTSRRMSSLRNRLVFAGLAAVSVGLCWLWYRAGANHSPFAVFLFYFYFIIHGFRDDAFFYRTFGDMPQRAAAFQTKVVNVLQALSVGLLFSLLWPAYAQLATTNTRLRDPILSNFFPSGWPFSLRLASMFVPMLVVAAIGLAWIARQFPGGSRGFWTAHRPLLVVYLLTIGFVLLAPIVGPWTFDVYILSHFVGWFLFAAYLLGRRPPALPPEGLWGWMRTTQRGFVTLHMGLVAAVAGLIAVNYYLVGLHGGLDVIVGGDSFYYWTIFHVTLSFLPR